MSTSSLMKASETAELKQLAAEAVEWKAIEDDGKQKKKLLRDHLVALQEALEQRRAEEERIRRAAEEEEERRAVAAEKARVRAEDAAANAALTAAAARRVWHMGLAGGLVLGAAAVYARRCHPALSATVAASPVAASRPVRLLAAAGRSRATRLAKFASRRLFSVAGAATRCVLQGLEPSLVGGLGGLVFVVPGTEATLAGDRVFHGDDPQSSAIRHDAPRALHTGRAGATGGSSRCLALVSAAALAGLLAARRNASRTALHADRCAAKAAIYLARAGHLARLAAAEEAEESEEEADELMAQPTVSGRLLPGMVPFMAQPAARAPPPAPRRALPPPPVVALPPPPPVVAVTPEEPQAAASVRDDEPEDDLVEEPPQDTIFELTIRPARKGRPEILFPGLVGLRTDPAAYHQLAATLAPEASIEDGDRSLFQFRHDLISRARAAPVTITVKHSERERDVDIDEKGDIAAQTAAVVREIRDATRALDPIKAKLREFEGRKVSVPGGRVAISVSKEAVYGYACFVDRGVWGRLDEAAQDACVEAGIIRLIHAAAATVALTVRDIGAAPLVPRKKKRAGPAVKTPAAKKGKLSAVVRAERGVTYYE